MVYNIEESRSPLSMAKSTVCRQSGSFVLPLVLTRCIGFGFSAEPVVHFFAREAAQIVAT